MPISVWPSGIFQSSLPVFKFIELRVPQGGLIAGYPSFVINLLYPVDV